MRKSIIVKLKPENPELRATLEILKPQKDEFLDLYDMISTRHPKSSPGIKALMLHAYLSSKAYETTSFDDLRQGLLNV